MSRALAITARQVRALCKGAKETGYVPVVQIGNVVVKLVPEERAIHEPKKADVDDNEEIRL